MVTNENDDQENDNILGLIGIALSGGGYRASLYALGALVYFVDARINKHVSVISSVSGGSITNGYVAQECDFSGVSPEQFERISQKFATGCVSV